MARIGFRQLGRASLLLLFPALCACTAQSTSRPAATRLAQSPYTMAQCTASWDSLKEHERINFAALMDAPRAGAGQLLCRRLIEAVRAGRLSATDLQQDRFDRARFIEVIQGR